MRVEENELGYRSHATHHYGDERLEALREHLQRQTNGTQQVAVSSQQSAALIDINLPPELAQRWQVSLLAWVAPGLPSTPQSVAGIQDFSTRNFCPVLNLKLQLQYGTLRATENALLDYPANGLTFEVNAARLALSVPTQALVSTSNFVFPLVGAFATPCVGRSKGKVLPTYTSPFLSVASTASGVFAAPPRAIGYRVYTQDSAAFTVDVDETDYTGGVVSRDYTAAAPLRTVMPATDWTYLQPRALALKVKNNDGATARSLQVCWVLDLA